jgi:hypothetical protein
MYMTLKREWPAVDGSKPIEENQTTISAGRYEIERIPQPYGYACSWLVIKGTLIGAAEKSWRDYCDPKHGDSEVVIEE